MSNKKIPMRQCVGCHEMKAKREMIRVIKTAPTEEGETEIILDATGRKNGRGAYICPNPVSYTHLTLPTNSRV